MYLSISSLSLELYSSLRRYLARMLLLFQTIIHGETMILLRTNNNNININKIRRERVTDVDVLVELPCNSLIFVSDRQKGCKKKKRKKTTRSHYSKEKLRAFLLDGKEIRNDNLSHLRRINARQWIYKRCISMSQYPAIYITISYGGKQALSPCLSTG